jgi:hypothetical protein
VTTLLEADDATLRERLAAHREGLETRMLETRRVLDELDRLISGEEEVVPKTTAPQLTVEEVAARTYVIRRGRAPMEEMRRSSRAESRRWPSWWEPTPARSARRWRSWGIRR